MDKEQTKQLIAQALAAEGILTPNTLAYALATVQHETGSRFEPVREGFSDAVGRSEARKRGYSGGETYYGRGYIQLTHDYNYKQIGNRIGMGDELFNNPDLALEPAISAKILAAFFKDRGVYKYADAGNFDGARGPVNGRDKAGQISNIARQYLPEANAIVKNPSPTPVPQQQVMGPPEATTKPNSFKNWLIKPVMSAEDEGKKTFERNQKATNPNWADSQLKLTSNQQPKKSWAESQLQLSNNNPQSLPTTWADSQMKLSGDFSLVPQPKKVDATVNQNYNVPNKSGYTGLTQGTYKVKYGDTLSSLARQAGTSVTEFQRANNITDPNKIRAGAVLNVPTGPKQGGSGNYTIRSGDTLGAIARSLGTSVGELQRKNGIQNANIIRAGANLKY